MGCVDGAHCIGESTSEHGQLIQWNRYVKEVIALHNDILVDTRPSVYALRYLVMSWTLSVLLLSTFTHRTSSYTKASINSCRNCVYEIRNCRRPGFNLHVNYFCKAVSNSRHLTALKQSLSSSSYVANEPNNSTSESNNSIFNYIRRLKQHTKSKYSVFKYIWPADSPHLKVFLILAMIFMILGKWVNVKVPFILQRAIDYQSKAKELGEWGTLGASASASLVFYGVSKALSVVFAEIKTCLFAHVSFSALRTFAHQIFSHLHSLDSEFHLKTPSGVLSVAYVRAIRGFQTMMFQLVFSVIPAALELGLVSNILYRKCGPIFSSITMATFILYLIFTVWITQWRVRLRQELVDVDNARNGFLIDSILNHEVVKYFTSESRELQKFDTYLFKLRDLNIASTYAIAVLNFGQVAMFCSGLTASLLVALGRVQTGAMSVGDLVAVNSMLLQLSIPFNFMGYTYQELRQAMVDMSFMWTVLSEVPNQTAASKLDQISSDNCLNSSYTGVDSITDSTSLPSLDTLAPVNGPSSIVFRDVRFHYPSSTEEVLEGVSFFVYPGQNVAIVGPSGSGKSTTLRLITRLFDATEGSVEVDGIDVKRVSMESLRKRIAVVPQDNSLFDETIRYNLLYGNPLASDNEVQSVIDKCNLRETVDKLPQGLETQVGERGARLSGGERQKVSIGRALLKDPTVILCDEVTSAVDAFAERDITDTLRRACQYRTTLTIAHRLSSIVHCDNIIVMDRGKVVEQGTHSQLLTDPEGVYARMWRVQNNPGVEAAIRALSSPLPMSNINGAQL